MLLWKHSYLYEEPEGTIIQEFWPPTRNMSMKPADSFGTFLRICLLCIFNEGSDRISSKLAHLPFCLAYWLQSLIWGRLLSLIEMMSMTKRLFSMPCTCFNFKNADYFSSTDQFLAEVPRPIREEETMRSRKDAQRLLWTLLLVHFGPANLISFN